MEELSVTGIVLSAMPYKEKDKLIQLFSVELGKITAILKGVSSPKAKLKFAGQPFCFGRFELTLAKDFYIVKGVELIDSFYEITSDYDNFSFASSMLEVCSCILKPNMIADSLFIGLVKSLQNLVYNNISAKMTTLKFFMFALEIIGYGLNFTVCDNCGMKFVGDIKYDKEAGSFRCLACSGGIKIHPRDFANMKFVANTTFEKLSTLKINDEALIECLKLVVSNLSHKLNHKFKSINMDSF